MSGLQLAGRAPFFRAKEMICKVPAQGCRQAGGEYPGRQPLLLC
jgi:hypothetical protein